MNHAIHIDVGPPVVRHRIRGMLQSDLPVGAIEILSHRHVRLREWSLVEATASYWRLYWGTSGSARVSYDGQSHELSAGQGMLIPPHTCFSSDCERPFSKWYIHFTFGGIGNLARPGIYPVVPTRRMQSILARACPPCGDANARVEPDMWRPLWVVELVTLAVQGAVSGLCMTRDVSPNADTVMHVIRSRAASGLTVKDLSRATGLSPREATRIVREVTGFTAARYMIELRLDVAMHLLKHTNQSIDSVARESGFPNRHYLTRMLAKHRQTTPAAFRRKLLR